METKNQAKTDSTSQKSGKAKKFNRYLTLIVIYAAMYEIFDTYNTSFYPTIVSTIQADLGIGNSGYYLITTIGSLGLYAVLILQILSDVIGRKPLVIISFFGMGFSVYLLGKSHTVATFAASLFLMYIFFSSDSWVILVSEEAPKDKRGLYSYIPLFFGIIGALMIPYFRDWLIIDGDPSSWSRMTLFGWLAMPLALIGLFLKETDAFTEKKRQKENLKQWNLDVIKEKLVLPFSEKNKARMIVFIIIGIIVGLNYTSFQTIESFFTSTLSVSSETISDIILIGSVGSVITYMSSGLLADKFGRRTMFIVYSILLSTGIPGLVFMCREQLLPMVYVFTVIAQIGFWGCFTLLKVYCVECFDTEIRGSASGWRSFSFAFGFTIGSLIASALTINLSLGTVYIIFAVWAVILIPVLVIKFTPETKGLNITA